MKAFLRRIFLFAAAIIRALPPIRGKVRIGQILYRIANRRRALFMITTQLYPERFTYRLNLTSAHERMAFLMNGYEPETTALLEALHRGGTILDIGANIGLIAIPLAARTRSRAGAEPHVMAFEALSSNYEALVWNVRQNGLESAVRALPIALGAERKSVKIQIEGDDPARTGTANILPASFEFKQIDLEIHALDDLWRDGVIPDDVTLMKIDTDGYDLEILRGARRLLAQQRPACHVELNLHCLGWHNQTMEDVLELVQGIGYQLLSQTGYNSGRFVPYRRGMPFFDNALLLPAEKMPDFARIVSAV
jgi:FkbM family methyltransferase